jgi:hypothetical protein
MVRVVPSQIVDRIEKQFGTDATTTVYSVSVPAWRLDDDLFDVLGDALQFVAY